MTMVIFGLTISSAWGNGHATLWRGLCRALHRRRHRIRFFEKDVPYYAGHRDLPRPDFCDLVLYESWSDVAAEAARAVGRADAVVVTSYCPDGRDASALTLASNAGLKVFYDLDTPVTLAQLARGESVPYLPGEGPGGFDLVLSFTGGQALDRLRETLGARRVAPLYGSVDPDRHYPVPPDAAHRSDLSYLGTYAADRQGVLEALFIAPARRRSDLRFAIAGSLYPADFPWTDNIFYVRHLPPRDHPAFFCSSGLTLNVTRRAMAEMGYCPSGRLFEAAACGTPILSDRWPGIEEFFEPGRDILLADRTGDALEALDLSPGERARIAGSARERTLSCHTADIRAAELEALLEGGGMAAAIEPKGGVRCGA